MAHFGPASSTVDGLGCGKTCACTSCRDGAGVNGLGCGKTCACTSCRDGAHLSEWYIEDDDDGDDEPGENTSEQPAVDPVLGSADGLGRSSAAKIRVALPYSQLAPMYDNALGRESFARTKRAFEFVAARYGIRFGSAADVGCGTGLFACYLSRCWRVPVFAVDRSADMLREAACRCRDPRIRFVEQDVRDLCLPCPVDLVTANFDTVNHLLTACDLGRAFRRIAGNLKGGGHFVFDVITRQQSPHRLAYVRQLRATGRKLFQKIRWNPRRGLLSITIVDKGPGRSPASVEYHTERAYSPALVGRLLLDAGFVVRGVHDATTLQTPNACPPRLLVIASKR